MRQRMKNKVVISLDDVQLDAVSDVEVTFDQKMSGVELSYKGDQIEILSESELAVIIPKEDAMKLLDKPIRYQAMYMEDGFPKATKIYKMPVDELLKDDGYGE